MPIDKSLVEPMLEPFRNMVKDCQDKKIKGEHFDKMVAILGEMDFLAQKMDDFAAYSGLLTQKQLFVNFSNAYGLALSSAVKKKKYTDDELMALTIKQYEEAIATFQGNPSDEKLKAYRTGEPIPQAELLIPPIKRALEIAHSGVSYPVFLRKMEEEGINQAMDGNVPINRDALLKEIEFAQSLWLPLQVQEAEEKLKIFEELAVKVPFGQPDPLEFELTCKKIEWKFEPQHIKWDAVTRRWSKLFEKILDWLDSFCSFALRDERWATALASLDQVRKNIQRTQECEPGNLKYREAILKEYFGLKWKDILTHETFIWEYSANRISQSDERLHLALDTYSYCKKGKSPPKELIERAEALYPSKVVRPNVGRPPAWGSPLRYFS